MWTCGACTLLNEDATAAACAACETPRHGPDAGAGLAGHKRARTTSPEQQQQQQQQRRQQPDPAELSDDDCMEMDEDNDDDDDDDDGGAFDLFEETPETTTTTTTTTITAITERAAPHDNAPPVSAAESMADAAMDARLAKSFVGGGSATATRKLTQDFKTLVKLMNADKLNGIEVSIPDESNGYHWLAEFRAPLGTSLHNALASYAKKYGRKPVVELEMLFDGEYPFSPPFVRVLRPRFSPRSGHVTIGGSICIELLTRSGWSPSYSIETLLVQLVALICSDEARAELDRFSADRPYGIAEARAAFARVAADHGWRA